MSSFEYIYLNIDISSSLKFIHIGGRVSEYENLRFDIYDILYRVIERERECASSFEYI